MGGLNGAGMTAEAAEEYTSALGLVMAGGWRQIALGRRLGVPQALGLSVQQWVDGRLGGFVRLSLAERPDEMREAVRELTKPEDDGGYGLSQRKAAEVLGVSRETVRRAADTNVSPQPDLPEGPVSPADTNVSGQSEPKEPKSHAEAHAQRMEASREAREATALLLPDLADLSLDRVEYGTEALAYLAGLEAGSADVCITSPPYWKKRTYVPGEAAELGQEPTPELYVRRLCRVLNEVGRVLKADGALFLNLGDTLASEPGKYRGDPSRRRGISERAVKSNGTAGDGRRFDVPPKSFVLVPERVITALVVEHGWRLAGKIVWHKLGHAPENVHDRLTQAWEPIYVLTRSEHAYFDRSPGRDDVWPIAVGRGTHADGHLAPFPEALVERAIKHSCEAGGTVLDPFAGSGTTLTVARRLGRRFLGCDLAPAPTGVG